MKTSSARSMARASRSQGSALSYLIGFVLSLVLTFGAYVMVRGGVMTGWPLLYGLTGLAMIQMLVQLLFFLHLRHEEEPRWKLLVFDLMLFIVTVLVIGSIWIMNNLNYHGHNPPKEATDQYFFQDVGFQP